MNLRRLLLAVFVVGGLLLPPATAHASPSDPSQWPEFSGADPELTATAHTIRFSGPDRYQTNLALGLALRGKGDFPFDTSDRTSGNATGLAQADDWWGAATCPRSIIVVAGDTFADALAAASLSDPTDQSQQPRLQRVAAEDPLFDPIGGFERPDTASAPVVVTSSGRSGARSLATSARLTATDLAKGGCTTAKEAIIVGGTNAVPKGVESDLIGIGYREVFRVAGADRYETAANVAQAMGTSAPTSDTCVDRRADDGSTRMGWYGNAAFEYRADAQSCRVLPRAVVLADGGTGADALAAGWWTSYWQVPVLLTAPDGTLPNATRVALQTMAVDTIIVLGGTARIPEDTVDKARFLAGAVAGRIAGADRTETSIAMAKAFGGWYPTGNGADFANDIACFAASSGSGASATGWPDALAAGPLCGRFTGSTRGSPVRALAPLTGADATTAATGGASRSHQAVPVILLPTGASSLPDAVVAFLTDAFAPASAWCSGRSAAGGCLGPGFGVIVGGAGAIPPGPANDLSQLLSGVNVLDIGDQSPAITGEFATTLDLGPVFTPFAAAGRSVCIPSKGLRDVRWLASTADADRRVFLGETDLLRGGVYTRGNGGSSEAVCVATGDSSQLTTVGVSLSGHVTDPHTWDLTDARHVTLSQPVHETGTRSETGGIIAWSADASLTDPVDLSRGDQHQTIVRATLDLRLTVSADAQHGSVSGTFSVATGQGTATGTVAAEALLAGTTWEIAGRSTSEPFASGPATGGFRATIAAGDSPSITWTFDGF